MQKKMSTSIVTYLGALRTKCVHIKSSNSFITDAPVDNNGKGEAFSPTDTVATALASCMMTIMGIKANDLDIDLTDTTATVTKVMDTNPRRISEIKVIFDFPSVAEQKHRKILENAALTCPVYYSLHPDIKKDIQFNWR